jgi:hypothetical protein
VTPPAAGGDGDGDGDDPVEPDTEGRPAGQRDPVSVALRELAPPDHTPSFWDDLDRRLADEPQLRLAPRAAIRPITQPPPVIDDRKLAEHLAGPRPRQGRIRPLRFLVWAVAIGVTAVLIAAALYEPDDETQADGSADSTTTSAPEGTDQSTTTTAPATTTTAPGTIDAAAPMAPEGVGPLRINTSFRDLQAAGVALTVDQATFEGSGGYCYDARVTGALDMVLRFRSPVAGEGVADPADGVLAAVGIDSDLPTTRTSDSGIGLGAPQDQVLATYAGNLEDHSHPYIPGGHVLIAPAAPETGLAIAFLTDGATVNQITVGAHDIVRYVDGCS